KSTCQNFWRAAQFNASALSILRPSLPASYSHSSLSIILLHVTTIFSIHYSPFTLKPLCHKELTWA
ncbi:hypothetical protein KSW92_15235, partial [Prevotella copri]|uniref:hypothetical protein n=1 Tax=Segatella copri TaxID=165179 RepID=UPI001C38609C